MGTQNSVLNSLIEVDDSVLIVIDVQEHFLAKLPAEERRLLADRIGWLVSAAVSLGVPIVATAEDIPELGGIVPTVRDRLPPGCVAHDKMVFGLAGDEAILKAVRDTGRTVAVLVGLETDVCVAHSALGLMKQGFQVVVLADGTASPGAGHEIGLERVRQAGGLIASVKSLYYEWVRTVERDKAFRARAGLPDGMDL